MKPARKIYDWASKKVTSPHAAWWLGVIFFLELVLFIPLDALLMLFCWENREKRFLYATIATISSTLCGLAGYAIGYFLWDAIGPFVITHLISPDFFNRIVGHYTEYQNGAVFIGSLIPVPFKAISLSAGFCGLSLLPFVVCVFLARAVRFFFIAQMMQLWGPQVKAFVDRHFNRLLFALGAKVAIAFTFFWAMT
jgi:membrane protein YqaA with SNARE-associated domain